MKNNLKIVNHAPPKLDANAIATGAPVYTDDLAPQSALVVKVLRSPHASAFITGINTAAAKTVPGVACVLTHEDVPAVRHSYAGANYPGNNPFDRLILDRQIRYIGDAVAIVAAENANAAEKAAALVKVEYRLTTPVLDFETAENHPTTVHGEEDYLYQMDIGGDVKKNILSYDEYKMGDFEAEFAACPVQLCETYYTKQNQQAMMETFRTFTYLDTFGRLVVVSSTQVPFHVRRNMARGLGIPASKIRVIKPRIGGGFGAKQSLVSEFYPAVVTLATGRPAKIIYTRTEAFTASNSRHQFRIAVRLGADTDGTVRALSVESLENAGAYGEHSVNVIGLSAHKTMPLYAKAKAYLYTGKAVYTNTMPGGAFRGFGATQGCFAVESTVNKMAALLNLCPTEVRLKNLPGEGQVMPAYYDEILTSCSLPACIETGKKMLGWQEKQGPKKTGPHTFRGVGMAVTMQGSGLTNMDACTVNITLQDGGFYALAVGSTDMGTGSDTILAQMAAETLLCPLENILVNGVDTDHSPYDKGSYASSTTYVTGNATVLAAKKLLRQMKDAAAERLCAEADDISFDGAYFTKQGKSLPLEELGVESVNGQSTWLTASASYSGKSSPPPFVAGFAEVEVDTETGAVTVLDLVGVVDCGTIVNKSLARVQAEGGFAQGFGMALCEDVHYTKEGRMQTSNFMQYKIPGREDMPPIRIAFEESFEPSGPFGAKSIGEVVINTPAPAIAAAVANAVGVNINTLPITAEKVLLALMEKEAGF